jgi:hypothetical protein
MAWERRGDGLYYYKAEREGGRVRKRSVGAGDVAELVAHADEAIRREREQRQARERAELERLKALAAPVEELSAAAGILAHAHLIDAGYHRRKGEYRRARSA